MALWFCVSTVLPVTSTILILGFCNAVLKTKFTCSFAGLGLILIVVVKLKLSFCNGAHTLGIWVGTSTGVKKPVPLSKLPLPAAPK